MNTPKKFTPAEANRTLPLVRCIVADILKEGARVRAQQNTASPAARHEDAQKAAARIQSLMAELAQIGCQYKDWDFSIGLVDFPAILNGKEVLLCWRSDEPEVRWYHGYMDGYAGRKPIPEDLLNA